MFLSVLQKINIKKIVKNFLYNHLFFYSVILFLVLPKNKKGLELYRECMNNILFNKLNRKNKKIVKKSNYQITMRNQVNKIWFCWFQGYEQSPAIVKACYKSIISFFKDFEIFRITEENFYEFTTIPEYIIEKWKKGIITNTHFSDILRTNLLVNNGGIWIDATVLFTNKLPEDIMKSDFFCFMTQKPGADGKEVLLSSWFIKSIPNHPIMLLTQDLLFNYWKKHNYLCDYFLFHIFLQISLNHYDNYSKSIPKYTNEIPHLLLFELPNKFSEEKFDNLKKQSFIHKLTYKLSDIQKEDRDNFYNRIIEEYDK